MLVNRKDLVVGEKYFIDGSRKVVGTFTKRIDDSIYFDCGEDCGSYLPSARPECDGLIGFWGQFGTGFEPVTFVED